MYFTAIPPVLDTKDWTIWCVCGGDTQDVTETHPLLGQAFF